MIEAAGIEQTLAAVVAELVRNGQRFALVGGLAVSVRAEIRFTRDVDLAIAVSNDAEAEALVYQLRGSGYRPIAVVEHDTQGRLATARVLSTSGVKVDLLFASSGIEPEIVESAGMVALAAVGGELPIARAEELLAMKVLSMSDQRLQDRLDAQRLLACNPRLDLAVTRAHLELIRKRGFHRGQDLEQKLVSLLSG
ncbi:MAG: nucleotidyl transferase AbiEii/AbiGii toxin family protein [Deltaproteobacteria bacterium]